MPRHIILLLIITITGSALAHANNMRGPNTLQKCRYKRCLQIFSGAGMPSSRMRVIVSQVPHSITKDSTLSAQYGYTFLKLYQNGLGKFIPSHCPMQPSCSRYSIEAISQYGLIKGVILTADRLLHETDEAIMVEKVWIKGRGHCCLDPVSRNVMFKKSKSSSGNLPEFRNQL